MRGFSRSFFRVLALGLLAGSGCQVVKSPAGGPDNTNNYCLPPQRFGSGAAAVRPAPPPLDTTALPQLSVRSQQLARAYGLTPALRRLVQLPMTGPKSAGDTYQAFVLQRRALTLRVVQAADEALRVAEELQCEKQRVDQATVVLQAKQTRRTRNFTLGSLLAGAASGTVSATILNEDKTNLNLVLTVTTAALSAGLGVATLLVNPELDYPLPNNLLADVWYQRPQPIFYPAGLWATLSEQRSGQTDSTTGRSPLQHIHRRWAKYDQLTGGKPAKQAQQQEMYFGRGGPYRVSDLQVRSSMLAQVESAVRVVNQDLQKLLVEASTVEPQ